MTEITRDSNGAELKDGDSVTLIKDLKVKGTSTVLKRGTLIKGIRLTGDPAEIECRAEKIKDLPIWCFHGADDNVVRASLSRDMIDAIKKAGGEPKYTEYPGVGHNSWDKAYATDELYTWFLEHKKK
jgi:predicted esterase